MMMVENFIYYTTKFLSKVKFIVVTDKPQETNSRLKSALNDNFEILCVPYKNVFSIDNFKKMMGFREEEKLEGVINKEIDVVIVLGGDIFTEDYSKLFPLFKLFQLYSLKKLGKKIYMLSQTIGPFHSWRENVAIYFLRKFDKIYTRERISFEYLHKFKLTNLCLSSDLAFLPLFKEENSDKIPIEINKPYIVVVPSEIIWKYSKIKDYEKSRVEYIEFLSKILVEIMRRFESYNLVILPFVLSPEMADDRLAGRDLIISLLRKGISEEKIFFIKDSLLPYQARSILRNSEFVLTGRMHAAISSLTVNIPFLAISYSRKFWGIIGDYFNLKQLIVDIRNYENYDDLYIASLERLEFIFSNVQFLKEIMYGKVIEMQQKVFDMFESLVDELEKI